MSDAGPVVQELETWLESVSAPEWLWYAKYLSANDTYAKANVHQGGPLLGKALLAKAFPALSRRADREPNPDLLVPARVDSHQESADLRLVWYNSRRLSRQANGRDEARLTRWGGADSAMVEPDATGSLVLFAFRTRPGGDADALRIWRCRSVAEENQLLDRIPDVAPGAGRLIAPMAVEVAPEGRCALADDEIPAAWRERFPSGEQLAEWAAARAKAKGDADHRLIARRRCEEAVFFSVERWHAMPAIRRGFASVEDFIRFAGSLTNRRKSRSGRSLELQTRLILTEERVPHSWTPVTEDGKSPDFIFPSIEAYLDSTFPASRLRMLAAKTTCKDRWRQILNEADRIRVKHLLTLQEGVSERQFREMEAASVRLVVPTPLIKSYPASVRGRLVAVEGLLPELRGLRGG
jgi:hypothetical protein